MRRDLANSLMNRKSLVSACLPNKAMVALGMVGGGFGGGHVQTAGYFLFWGREAMNMLHSTVQRRGQSVHV